MILPADNHLLYADDAKFFRVIREPEDHARLQTSLHEFQCWCNRNALSLCTHKCEAITFSRSRCPSLYEYALDGQSLARKQCVKDLGVLLDTKLSFKDQLDHVVATSNRMLGLVINMCEIYSRKGAGCDIWMKFEWESVHLYRWSVCNCIFVCPFFV